jgi:hypothetical protein
MAKMTSFPAMFPLLSSPDDATYFKAKEIVSSSPLDYNNASFTLGEKDNDR